MYKASTLTQAQGFRLVTPDPFLMRGLGLGTRLPTYVYFTVLHCTSLYFSEQLSGSRENEHEGLLPDCRVVVKESESEDNLS